jgi:hypothetical protein
MNKKECKMEKKQVSFKDKHGNIWLSIIDPKEYDLKVGDKIEGGLSPLGKAIGEVELVKIEEVYYDVSGQ